MRPLPALTPANEWFWTSGADGKLRIQGCQDCGTLVHPPVPICPSCRSRAHAPTEVSGLATVVGVTVNVQQWHPDFTPPYVIAIVALDESPDVRLTTNVVGCAPGEVHVGQRVRVSFEQSEDVYLPLFEPLADPATVDPATETNPIAEPSLPPVRRPLSDDRFEHRVVLSGIGRSKVGRRLGIEPLSLTVDASLAAIADAGLRVEDIDGLSTYPGPAGMGMSEGGVTAVEEALRIRPTWINGGMDLPGQGGAILQAMLAVSAGLCRHVLCFRTVWESSFRHAGGAGGGGRVSGWQEWRAPFGAMSAAGWIALCASQYFHRYGADREMLAAIALNGRANAGRNPDAIYRAPMTLDDYMNARMISTPFGLYDCDVPCDGSVAVIVSAADTAADLPKPAIRVEAVGTQVNERISWDQGTITHEPLVMGPATHLWTRTDLRPADIDLACLYDGFTFNAISWLESLGFCGIGEAKDWLDKGRRIALDGDLPLNPHGGQLSEGRLHGFGFFYEAITQLRREAGPRQVADARTAVVSTGGGAPGGAFLLRRADA
ncbi:OB-fold domain-containing protein [Frankia sp. CNm7]|uniref:OB-fold domain-containing protein n=1 Tax=Frankia nepalensis TaxID=1836974 RepID=A0A937URZ1_9ACTN|nr:OB-fold domain-containing protein [Frankia nepalensis]MBL7500188.1 OB-fold domain-containing protein [Frankia nepalensis]MBL7509432.1 OB-fold domain-containing protein [Frankia nepalensis]MBL7524810.1 OB-fold domain-containing protein [Frankia nepalensis]MBL7631618.1 OB-fold domain-containing protein [Frankia nepalensis]